MDVQQILGNCVYSVVCVFLCSLECNNTDTILIVFTMLMVFNILPFMHTLLFFIKGLSCPGLQVPLAKIKNLQNLQIRRHIETVLWAFQDHIITVKKSPP